jgi:hypothetical protein
MPHTPKQLPNLRASERDSTCGNPLRVLLSSRTTLFSTPGGDTTVLLKTAESLRLLGCEVTSSNDLNHPLDGYDIVHLYNLTRPQEMYYQARRATKRGIPVILTPIYVESRSKRLCRQPEPYRWEPR